MSSAIFLVSTVIRVRCFLSTRLWISPIRSSIWPLVGRTSTVGSTRPVGRMLTSIVCWGACSLFGLGGGGDISPLWYFALPSRKRRGWVFERRGQPKAVIDQGDLARPV